VFTVRHNVVGRIDTLLFPLDVRAEVESLNIKEISPYGGTLIRVTGRNFSPEQADNSVEIRYNGGVGRANCFVESASPLEIECRVQTGINREAGSLATLVVFLKGREEADCDRDVCRIAFSKTMPTVTEIEGYFDKSDLKQKLRVIGTDFTGTLQTTLLEVEGIKQTTELLKPTEAIFSLH